ncbi:peptidase M55 [Virgibacillus halodenitrificans]|uniref:Peptidase M55 n=1 Tax=Virgibacillus halodenitrificans TaxID=1482 RepID=A0AAC9J4G3_VIRHA|nr:M55 family metallopeptidase [Virgibacillus halodenitrificans]APC49550.1 peptidase M55 [Virgibacillus halodenitrificans]CDQ31292.1 D-aminopeptidase [Virgibacillus halodenitrificans]
MKLFISADIEGVSGVVDAEHTGRTGREHDRARMYMTQEVNACIEGALEAGVREVVVNDSHGTMRNILFEHLHPKADLISGSPKKLAMVEGLTEKFDAAIFIGYHTRMGTNGILNHTFHGRAIRNIRVNGNDYGEFGLNAAVAGYYGVPVVMVSGCDLLSEEATALIPNINTIVVKKTMNRTTARNVSMKQTHEKIRSMTLQAIKERVNNKPYLIQAPLHVEVSFMHTGLADIAETLPVVKRVDHLTVAINTDTIIDAYRYIRSLIMMVGSYA